MSLKQLCLGASLIVLLAGCQAATDSATPSSPASESASSTDASAPLSLEFEKYTLDNGLDVVLHVDRSDPVVAINLAVHVGSGREVTGRTGFAHLFEHLLFLDSENLGYGGLDEMNTRIGGEGTNGFTTTDMTQYFQAVPKDALEKIIWAEADKLGYFIKTVSQNVVDNEKQVVKNEKRQRVDNQPYGHNFYVIHKAIYPESHPYNWQVIGSLADLDAATLADVHAFYEQWYTPNNVTVTLTGDFDVTEARGWIEKYFGEIPGGDPIPSRDRMPGKLDETVKLYHEDNFATVPQLTAVWPTVEEYHPDSYPLNVLMTYLTEGKRAPLNEVLIDEQKLTSSVSGFQYSKELSGEFYLFVSPKEGEDIDGLIPALNEGFARFEANGISQADLNRIKAGQEVEFYSNIQSALGKAIGLGEYNVFTGDPGFIETDIARLQAVTPEDVMRVYNTYIKDQPRLYTSFVPKGQLDLALEGSMKADVVEEAIVEGEGAPVDFDPAARVIENPTPSSFDRTVEPEFGPAYDLPSPQVWTGKLSNGVELFGMESSETPLVNFSIRIDAGNERGDFAKPAIPDLTGALLEKGTANKTTAELEDAIKSLGSDVSITTSATGTYVRGSTLSRNFDKTIELVQEMLLEPRWDAEEFDLLKIRFANQIDQSAANPNSISAREAAKLRYPEGHILSYAFYGPKDKLDAVTLDDLKTFYANNFTASGAKIRVVGDVSESDVKEAFVPLASAWEQSERPAVDLGSMNSVETSEIYFYDIPGAKQSILRIERPALEATHPDYALANAINFPLGGIYTSLLNTELRVNKGYTYGIRSGFSGTKDSGTFSVRSSVRTNVTKESLDIINEIVGNYGPDFTQEDLDLMKDALIRGQALKSETLGDTLSMVSEISAYGYPSDYRARNARAIAAMELDDVKRLASEHMRPDAMRYVIVGDADSQAEKLKDLGFGDPVIINE